MGFTVPKIKEKEKSIYNVKDLSKLGYLYDNNGAYVPYPDKEDPEFYFKISRTDSKKSEIIYALGKKDGDEFHTSTEYKSDKLISQTDKKLTSHLQEAAENAGFNVGEYFDEFVNTFLKNIRQQIGLEVLKKSDFKFPESPEGEYKEIYDYNSDSQEDVFKFDNYPKLIRDEALAIIKDGTLYEKYVNSISITHAENDAIKQQLALISVSPFIGEPIHTELNADSGEGKTDVTTETVKNIPEIYVHHLSTVSPKNIYYDKDSYGAFNILIFDDVILSDENIGLLKVLTDNNKPVKELKTVIDKKAVNFTLEGTFLVIITYAKDNPDEELLNRLYKLNMDIAKNSGSKIKNKIKSNTIVNAGHNEIISKSREFIQAAIQYLIEQEIEIFNPFAVLFDPSELANRNIGHFITMVKCKSFFHTHTLKSITIAGRTIIIGSYEDFWTVAKIWSEENDTQKYKLNSTQEKILEILPEKTRDDIAEEIDLALEEYKIADPKSKVEIMDRFFTRDKISKLVGVGRDTIRYYLDRSQGTAKSLVDKGLIGRLPFDSSKDNSPLIYYKVKKGDGEVGKGAWKDWKNENSKHFNTPKSKMSILLSLLYLVNITVNEKGHIFLKKYCESENHSIDLNDYESYYNFINDAIRNFDFDEYAVKIEEAKLSDLTYVISLLEMPVQEDEKNEDIHQDHDSTISTKQSNAVENAQNDDSATIAYGDQDFPSTPKHYNINEILGSDIDDLNYAAKICELLVYQDLTQDSIFSELHPDISKDNEFGFEYYIDLGETLVELAQAGYITRIKSDDSIIYYHLNDDLKNKLI